LVLQHAAQRYLDEGVKGEYYPTGLSFDWAGKKLSIIKEKYDWKLVLSGPEHKVETLLHLVPWLNFTEMPGTGSVSDNTLIAWPALDQIPTDHPTSCNYGVAISPMDLYCIERLGWYIDKKLNQILLRDYANSIDKIPKAPAQWLKDSGNVGSIQLNNSQPAELIILEDFGDEYLNSLMKQLEASNAKAQAQAVKARVMVIRTLEICPVCESKDSHLQHQTKGGFQIQCPKCSSRYLRRTNNGQEYEIKMSAENIGNGFTARGRWFQF